MPNGASPTSYRFVEPSSGETRVTVSSPLSAVQTAPSANVTPTGLCPTRIGAPATCGPLPLEAAPDLGEVLESSLPWLTSTSPAPAVRTTRAPATASVARRLRRARSAGVGPAGGGRVAAPGGPTPVGRVAPPGGMPPAAGAGAPAAGTVAGAGPATGGWDGSGSAAVACWEGASSA